jgi:prepilin signal peptidase PulO-like enzyme (type II secretory pathway)
VNVLTTAINPFTRYLWVGVVGAVVAALAFSHLYVYRKGKHDEKLDHVAAVAAANEDSRRLERARQSRADQAASIAAGREAGIRAAADRAGDAVRKLRDAITARNLAEESGAAAAKRAATYGELLGQSATAYRELAATCDRHVNDVRLLLEAWPTDGP